MRKFDLEDRLIDFAVSVISLNKSITHNYTADYLAKQLTRSSCSAALNYGEAQGAESRNDFIHKMKLSLKELRETLVCLKIIQKSQLNQSSSLNGVLIESNELISIFVRSIETAKKHQKHHIS